MRRADRAGSGGYSGQFWALYFLQQVSKVDALTSAYIVGAGSRGAVPPDNFARAVCIDDSICDLVEDSVSQSGPVFMATPFASKAIGLRAIHQRASVVRYAEFGELHCKLGHAVLIEPSLQCGSPENGSISVCGQRLSAF